MYANERKPPHMLCFWGW